MKKKILLFIALISAFICLFAISSSATAINKDTTVTLDGSFTDANGNAVTTVNLYDADGDALIWYLDTNGKLVSAKIASLVTVNSEGVISFTDQTIFYSSQAAKSAVVINLRDNVKVTGTEINWDGTIEHFDAKKGEGESTDTNMATTGFQFGTYNFTGSNLQYFYFPKTAKSITKRMFQGTPTQIIDIEPGTPISKIGFLAFYDCDVAEILIPNDVEVLTSVPGQGLFQNCKNLSSIVFEEDSKLWDAGHTTFNSCSSLKELYLPNSVKTVGYEFARGSGLEVISFGASFEYFTMANPSNPDATQNAHMWVFYGCKLKKVYMPASYEIISEKYAYDDFVANDTRLNTFDRVFANAGNFTFYFTGTEEEINTLKTRIAYAQENANLISALNKIYSYDEYVAAGSPTGSCAVYDYNLCKAFYNDVHQTADEANDHNCTTDDTCRCKILLNPKTADAHTEFFEIVYLDYSKAGKKLHGCSNDDCTVIDVEDSIDAIITTKGYSIKNDGCGIVAGYDINIKALEEYETAMDDIEIGIIMANSSFDENAGFMTKGEDGKYTLNSSYGVQLKITSRDYSRINSAIANFTTAESELKLVMALYVVDAKGVSYIQHEGQGTYADEVKSAGVTLDVVTISKIATLTGIDLVLPEPKALPVENKEN